MRLGILALAIALGAALSSGASLAGSDITWPDEFVGPGVSVPTDPVAGALADADAAWASLADSGVRTVDVVQGVACTLRAPVAVCGEPGPPPPEGTPSTSPLPAISVDPAALGLPSGASIATSRAPGATPFAVNIPIPTVVVDPQLLAQRANAQSLESALPAGASSGWVLAREVIALAADSYPAGAAAWVPAKLVLEPVHIANPVPEPSGHLGTPTLGPHAANGAPGAHALRAAPPEFSGESGRAGGNVLAPLPGPMPGAPMDFLVAPTAPFAVAGAGDAAEQHAAFSPVPAAWSQAEAAARMIAGTSLLLPAWALYRRVRASMALDQPQRRDIYERVVADPGLTPSDLRAATGLHYTTCVHHLRVLSQLGFIEMKRVGGQVRCFENHRRYGEAESHALAALRSPTSGKLLHIVAERPALTQAEAAKALGVTRSTVKHHVDRLAAWGVLQTEQDGPHVRLRLAVGAMDALRVAKPAAPAPVQAPAPAQVQPAPAS